MLIDDFCKIMSINPLEVGMIKIRLTPCEYPKIEVFSAVSLDYQFEFNPTVNCGLQHLNLAIMAKFGIDANLVNNAIFTIKRGGVAKIDVRYYSGHKEAQSIKDFIKEAGTIKLLRRY